MTTPKPAPPLTEDDVRTRVNALVLAAGSMRTLAHEWGISPAYLCDFVNNRRGPGPAILGPLGLAKVETVTVEYVKATDPKAPPA